MNTFPTLVKSSAKCLALLVVLVFAHGMARADEITVQGFTNGCFGAGCIPPQTSAQQTAPLLGLTYNNSIFMGTTAGGFLAIGDMPRPPGTQNTNNLGSFTLEPTPAAYTGQMFTLRVTFTLPAGINGSNTSTFSAVLTGTVMADHTGGVFVDFNNAPIVFTFSNAQATGSFSFNVNDVSVIAGGIVPVTGNITGAQQTPRMVPEPASLLLFGSGLLGVGAGLRHRRRRSQ